MAYEQDVFYDTTKITFKKKVEIINYAKDHSYALEVDKLDCSESFARQKIDMSFEDVMEKFNNSCHFTIIHRKGYSHKKNTEIWKWKGEVGFSTMGRGVGYFLWVFMEEDELHKMTEHFKLQKKG